MTNSSSAAKTSTTPDQPYFDPTSYGNGTDDAMDATLTDENAAITHHSAVIGGKKIDYTATAGHLVIVDPSSSKPEAKLFYVAFTQDNQTEESRPVTFFYNGGPGGAAGFVGVWCFAPESVPDTTPAVYAPPRHHQGGKARRAPCKKARHAVLPRSPGLSAPTVA